MFIFLGMYCTPVCHFMNKTVLYGLHCYRCNKFHKNEMWIRRLYIAYKMRNCVSLHHTNGHHFCHYFYDKCIYINSLLKTSNANGNKVLINGNEAVNPAKISFTLDVHRWFMKPGRSSWIRTSDYQKRDRIINGQVTLENISTFIVRSVPEKG